LDGIQDVDFQAIGGKPQYLFHCVLRISVQVFAWLSQRP
jgi:hypothetical protein